MAKLTGNQKAEKIAQELDTIGKKFFDFVDRTAPWWRREVIHRIFILGDVTLSKAKYSGGILGYNINNRNLDRCVNTDEVLEMFKGVLKYSESMYADNQALRFDRGVFGKKGASIKFTTGDVKGYGLTSFKEQSVLYAPTDLELVVDLRINLNNKNYRFRIRRDKVEWRHITKR